MQVPAIVYPLYVAMWRHCAGLDNVARLLGLTPEEVPHLSGHLESELDLRPDQAPSAMFPEGPAGRQPVTFPQLVRLSGLEPAEAEAARNAICRSFAAMKRASKRPRMTEAQLDALNRRILATI
jgi:hypothetical protein